jgi:hypothetical protein
MVLAVVASACTKNNAAPETKLNEKIPGTGDSSGAGNAKYAGTFSNGPYGTVTGIAKVYLQNGKYILALENVAISNGPDLHVYLSKEVKPINFIELGKLKSTNGNQLYDINGDPDFTSYKYALIHCQQYNHLFGSAELK